MLILQVTGLLLGSFGVYRAVLVYYSVVFERYADVSVQLVLGKEQGKVKRVYGSVVFEVKSHKKEVKEIVLTDITDSRSNMVVNDFGKLYFDLDKDSRCYNNMLSIGMYLVRKGGNVADVINLKIRGYIVLRNGTKRRFIKRKNISALRIFEG